MNRQMPSLGPLFSLLVAIFIASPILSQSQAPLTLGDAIRSTLLRHPLLRIQEQQAIANEAFCSRPKRRLIRTCAAAHPRHTAIARSLRMRSFSTTNTICSDRKCQYEHQLDSVRCYERAAQWDHPHPKPNGNSAHRQSHEPRGHKPGRYCLYGDAPAFARTRAGRGNSAGDLFGASTEGRDVRGG